MAVEFEPLDISDHLDSDEMIAGYLSAAAEDEDPNVLLGALLHAAKAHGMMQVATAAGLNRESLYKALKPGAHPRYETVQAVLRALGVKLTLSARAVDAGDDARRAEEAVEAVAKEAVEGLSALAADQVALFGADKASAAQVKEVTIEAFRRKPAAPVDKAEPAGKARPQTRSKPASGGARVLHRR